MPQERSWLFLFFISVVGVVAATAPSPAQIEAVKRDGAVDVTINGSLFTSYLTPTDWKFPYFWPVNGPASGESVTAEKGIDYPHHRSLYFGCDRVGGCNFWAGENETGQIRSLGPAVVESGTRVIIEDTCEWVCPGQGSLIRDRRLIGISAPNPNTRLMDFRFDFAFLQVTHIEKSNHSLFSAEVVPSLSVREGGTLVNANGERNEEGTFGKAAVWCDYSGERDGIREGLAIIQHPDNPDSPWPYFTRDYGFFSPTPLYWIEEDGLTVEAGAEIVLRFLVVVHKGGVDEIDLDAIYQDWIGKNLTP